MYQIRLVICLVCFYILLANTAFSQDTVQQRIAIIASPASLVMGNYAKIKVRIQAELHSRFAVGTDVKYYFSKVYPGYQILPFAKIFFRENNSKGLYVYVNVFYGQNKGLPEKNEKYYPCYGAGFGGGWQVLFGHSKRGILDLALGLKGIETKANISMRNVPDSYDDYYFIGPGSFVDGMIGIGYRF
ncbi:MAG: hypothetical protein IPG90_09280 [Bacteroidetes bacterium]|nr:hypothetical protein [Bacteroidota bacterium]MBK6838435.1 hypothetical protein [Bacteroidota bacterium]